MSGKRKIVLVGGLASGLGLWIAIGLVLAAVAAWLPTARAHQDEDEGTQLAACRTGQALATRQRTVKWGPTQRRHAATIVAVAKDRGLPPRAAQIAVATAIQESRLRNLNHGDRDSLGLFQQRPSQGWGSPEQVRDPVYAAGQFYDRLVKIDGWKHKLLTEVAQSIQRSAYPKAYAQWEQAAKKLVEATWKGADLAPVLAGDGGCGHDQELPDVPASKAAQRVIGVARSQLGVPYQWGGGNIHGPTKGGFDCSGLMVYAFYQGTDGRVKLPRTSQIQRTVGQAVPQEAMRPGDVIVINNDGNWGHVGLYVGDNRMIHAPRTGKTVEVVGLDYWRQFDWDVRRVL